MLKKNNRILLLLHWAGPDRFWLLLSVVLSLISGLLTMVPYVAIYQLMEAIFNGSCTQTLAAQIAFICHAAFCLIWLFRCCLS